MPGYVEITPERLLQAADRSLKRGLREFGEAVSRDAATSLRGRNRPSLPGEAPSIWNGALGQIGATVQDGADGPAVRIGPELQPFREGGGLVPAILESGGTSTRGTRIEPRPYLVPAFQRQIKQNIPQIWRDELK